LAPCACLHPVPASTCTCPHRPGSPTGGYRGGNARRTGSSAATPSGPWSRKPSQGRERRQPPTGRRRSMRPVHRRLPGGSRWARARARRASEEARASPRSRGGRHRSSQERVEPSLNVAAPRRHLSLAGGGDGKADLCPMSVWFLGPEVGAAWSWALHRRERRCSSSRSRPSSRPARERGDRRGRLPSTPPLRRSTTWRLPWDA